MENANTKVLLRDLRGSQPDVQPDRGRVRGSRTLTRAGFEYDSGLFFPLIWLRMLAPIRLVCGTWTGCRDVVTRSVRNRSVDKQIGQRTRSLDASVELFSSHEPASTARTPHQGRSPLSQWGSELRFFVVDLASKPCGIEIWKPRREPADNCYADSSLAAVTERAVSPVMPECARTGAR
jgi:hypothetical protein